MIATRATIWPGDVRVASFSSPAGEVTGEVVFELDKAHSFQGSNATRG
jgi:hypothetical protein